MEDVRTVVETEHWEAMPVQAGFAPVDIKEIRNFIQQNPTEESSQQSSHSSLLQRNLSTNYGDVSALASLHSTGNPFSEQSLQRNREIEIESDEEDEELKQEYVAEEGVINENENLSKQNNEAEIGTGASVTIVCVNLIRYIGNYLQMMKTFQPIANEVFQGVAQLYQYYLFTVFYFFSSKPVPTIAPGISLMNSGSSFNYHSLFQRNTTNEQETPNQVSFIDCKLMEGRKFHLFIYLFVVF